MDDLFRLPAATRENPAVDAWFEHGDALRALVQPWFDLMHGCGPDVTEILHDGMPTACVGDAAFAYVAAFTTHASIGFFHGASLPDPAGLLEGSGRRMRHVKLRWDRQPVAAALEALIAAAYRDICARLGASA
jgi:hypothetical protein